MAEKGAGWKRGTKYIRTYVSGEGERERSRDVGGGTVVERKGS